MAEGYVDLGGQTLTVKDIEINVTAPGKSGSGTALSATELTVLDGVTAGTVTASKAVVVDSSKNIATFGTIASGAITAAGLTSSGRVTTTDGVASGTTKVVGGTAFVDVATSDAVTAVASNNSFVAFAQTYAMPANTLKAGTVARVRAHVRVTDASGTDTLTCELRLGGTSLIATTAVDPGAAGDHHTLEFFLISRAAPSGTSACVGYGTWGTNTGGTQVMKTAILASTNFATNGALTWDVRAKWSSNTASTSANLESFTVEIV